ncbi:MAG: type II secretion system F family protein, partial [Erysipelotrichaceae bacterium]|nr:type II secretion system F family protein [Erysipelotrichaceae bacterium]
MPRYKYTGIKSNGKKVKGVLIANNDRDLFARLRDLDIYMETF